jgi:Uma2 family endonuclease
MASTSGTGYHALMVTAVSIDASTIRRSVDQRVVLHDVSWDDFESLLAIRGESAAVRMTYLEGELELMSPSQDHESIKKFLARLLEAYAEERDIDLNGFGSWTVKSRRDERGVEPDECYSIGRPGPAPDLAIEVIWTSGGLDKLAVYRKLGVREVWIWKDGTLCVHALVDERFVPVERSELLPDLDIALLVSFIGAESQTQAVREFRAALRRA